MQMDKALIPGQPATPPGHKELPDKDGSIVTNFQEHPQSNLLTECLMPRLRELYPDGQFCIGCDSGIYWRHTREPLEGCKAPDWFLVVGVPPMLDGEMRRSYVLWQEGVRPLIVIEYVSGDGSEERDTTPYRGKFWVYEQGICAAYYAIFEASRATALVYRLEGGRYRTLSANVAGRFPIEPLGIELGVWEGTYRGMTLPWLRAWDARGGEMFVLAEERADAAENLASDLRQMLSEETERAEEERKRAEEESKRAQSAEERARKLAEQLRALGIDPAA